MNLAKTEEIPQGYQVPRHALALQPLPVQPGQKIHEVVAADRLQGKLALLRKLAEFGQIPAISGDGIRRKPFFDPDVRQKRRDGCRYLHQTSEYPPSPPAARRLTAIP